MIKLYDRAITLCKVAKIKFPPTQVEMELTTTFGDLDGREVCFPEGCSNQPSKQLLALHACTALLYAKARYSVPDTSVLYLDQEMSVSDDLHTEESSSIFTCLVIVFSVALNFEIDTIMLFTMFTI
jgi:hypothetical protein